MEIGIEQGQSGMQPEPVGGSELGKTEFLQLLVSQLQHQDPMEPMSNSEFVAQLAQFSSVEQLVSVNEGINLLGIQQMGMSNAQASSMIGKMVEVNSDTLQVGEDDESVSAGFNLSAGSSSTQIKIRNAAGEVVRTIEMGPQEKGSKTFDWDCRDENGVKVPPGAYRLDVVAVDGEGNPVSWESRVRGIVDGVSYESGYPELNIGSIKVSMSDIIGVFPTDEEP